MQAVRWGKWRLYRTLPEEPWRLYDLNKDPREENDVAQQFPEIVKQLEEKHSEWESGLPPIYDLESREGTGIMVPNQDLAPKDGWIITDGRVLYKAGCRNGEAVESREKSGERSKAKSERKEMNKVHCSTFRVRHSPWVTAGRRPVSVGLVWCLMLLAGQVWADKPSVLFINVDDWNDWNEVLQGHPQAITPNIKRLAERGVDVQQRHLCIAVVRPLSTCAFYGHRAIAFRQCIKR